MSKHICKHCEWKNIDISDTKCMNYGSRFCTKRCGILSSESLRYGIVSTHIKLRLGIERGGGNKLSIKFGNICKECKNGNRIGDISPKEALEELKQDCENICPVKGYDSSKLECLECYCGKAIEVLEFFSIPVSIDYDKRGDMVEFKCNNCGKVTIAENICRSNFCDNCGKAIKWD